ncbi:type VI secretion system tip protein VgrG [Urechidicola croceus]|uniref:Uncharacterized protein n=1 Tax=Urechidicola croceus TaxID=1850246 RepID=A0A1D8P817_9FLAO|nr:type VI secretion system tip protein VgrG [Urechidicola croceus]AOW20708.1 hypothetical protein LPB138_08475 [Urechidicola croceus]
MAKVLQEKDGLIGFDIFINGSKIKDTVEVAAIYIQSEVNKISSASVLIHDGGAMGVENNPFTNSEGKDFIPGNEIKITLGYDGKNIVVFEGIIITQRLMVKIGKSQLEIKCKDKAVNMTKGRFNTIHQDKSDSDVIKSIASNYGLKLTNTTTKLKLPALIQYNCTDWDFIVIRAEMNNSVVLTDKNNLVIKDLDFSESPKYEINCADFVIDIDLDIDCENIADSFELTSWNDKDQKENKVTVKLNDSLSQGNLSAKKMAILSNDAQYYTSATISEDELKLWGNSISSKTVLSKIQGKIVVPGITEISAGDVINISGFSTRFNGKAYVSKIYHSVKEGEWTTTLFIGQPIKWHASLPDVQDISASGLIPASNGFQIAKVKKIDEDPDGNYRVLVTLPTFIGTGQDDGIWARMSFPYASNEAGFFFFPEIDDEVLVTFINNDPRFPVVTGALYNEKNKPKETPDEKNQFKSIYSKSGINIRFDDEDKILVIQTPGENVFTLDDKNKKIELKDVSGNSITMDDSGIVIDSSKDIKLTAKGNIDVSATSGVSINAKSDVNVDGSNVNISAKVGFTAKGNASAEVSASGQTTVKGAMVMIN